MNIKLLCDKFSALNFVSSFVVIAFSSHLLKDNSYVFLVSVISLCWVIFKLHQISFSHFYGKRYFLLSTQVLLIITIYILAANERLLLIPANIILYKLFKEKGLTGFPLATCCAVHIMFIMELLGYWGFPFTSYLIWFWGIPFLLAISFLLYIVRIFPIYSLSSALVLFMLLNQIGLYYYDGRIFGVESEKNRFELAGINNNVIKNISKNNKLVTSNFFTENVMTEGNEGKWLILSPSNPKATDVFLKDNVKNGEYYLFVEHDIKTNFGVDIEGVKDESYERKGPWNVYRPHMSRILESASNRDVLYCSNIGTSIDDNSYTYPLVWEYNEIGIPIILSAGEFYGNWRLTYLGDSDPIVDFLAPYNMNFLRSLFGLFDISEIIKALILGIFIYLSYRNKRLNIIAFAILFFIFIANFVPGFLKVNSDIAVFSDKTWLSPHIETNFSNMPKILAQNGLDVVVEPFAGEHKLNIYISCDSNKIFIHSMLNKSKLNIIFLLPGDEIEMNDFKIKVIDRPLEKQKGLIEDVIFDIAEPRNLDVDGVIADPILKIDDRTYVIGTNSPQRILGIGGLVK